jgi:hypothetical protein
LRKRKKNQLDPEKLVKIKKILIDFQEDLNKSLENPRKRVGFVKTLENLSKKREKLEKFQTFSGKICLN